MRRRQPWSKWSAWASLLVAGCGGDGLVRGGLWRTAGATNGTNWVAGRGSVSAAAGTAGGGGGRFVRPTGGAGGRRGGGAGGVVGGGWEGGGGGGGAWRGAVWGGG